MKKKQVKTFLGSKVTVIPIKCSQARVNNASVKNNLGFICGINSCICQTDSFGKYLSMSSLKIWLAGEILVLSRHFAQYDISIFSL